MYFGNPPSWAYDMEHMSLTPWGLKLKLPVIKDRRPGEITALLSAKLDGTLTGPLGLRLRRLEGSEDEHYQRAGWAAVRVVKCNPHQIERRVIHLVHGDLGYSRTQLNAENAKEFPRFWLRSLSPSLTLAAVDPKAEWNEDLQLFQVSEGDLDTQQRRVLVLLDAEIRSGYFVIVATVMNTTSGFALRLL